MSACDTCSQPGHCCTSIPLRGGLLVEGDADGYGYFRWLAQQPPLVQLVWMAERWLPFMNGRLRESDDRPVWDCPMLGEDGRCMDYGNRPELCRDYQPKSDWLCIEYEGYASGDA